MIFQSQFNKFQPSVAFHTEASHLICSTNQLKCYNAITHMKCNTALKCFSNKLLSRCEAQTPENFHH